MLVIRRRSVACCGLIGLLCLLSGWEKSKQFRGVQRHDRGTKMFGDGAATSLPWPKPILR
jgi:hypothetical protein